MYARPYDWPTFNNYRAPPSQDNLPTEIFSAQWLKREIARSVLQQDLPVSALAEAEVAVENLKRWDMPSDPPEVKPTDPATFSKTSAENSGHASHQALEAGLPQETGSSHARTHLHGHQRRKWHH
ncbi:uncharacterized protein N7498_002229 [Penicillium cinerascens]|uniref:Uncharacterized protein n=1 Tax=Penicillium cinerascens TaxID=70096 RepID=A0A9W9TAQ2_9EURO|nr:uncharacterized protein N7498_002229 [Penicillium cinerascens]KAJ5215822.1 hypothetical protein N7498_002229 [Penicillium cinerascens]